MADEADGTDEAAARKRRKGTWTGLVLIAFGLIGAVDVLGLRRGDRE